MDNFGNFEIRADVLYSAISGSPSVVVLGVTNTFPAIDYDNWSNGIALSLDTSPARLRLHERGGSTDVYNISISTVYYIILDRIGTTFRARIYSDIARTTLLDTLTIEVAATAYRYFYVTSNKVGLSSDYFTGYTENVDIVSA